MDIDFTNANSKPSVKKKSIHGLTRGKAVVQLKECVSELCKHTGLEQRVLQDRSAEEKSD